MPASDFRLFANIGLDDSATGTQTSTVGEPSLGNNGRQLFVTGNWYATRSLDNGANWQFVSPSTTLPSAAGGFCCDQLTEYVPSRDITVWLLQYRRDGNGENVYRIAIKRGATLDNNAWHWWDFSPRGVNADWTGQWFDYPHMATTDDHLFVTFNVFNGAGRWQRAVVFKFPLDTLEAGTSLGYRWWSTTQNGSLRLTKGAGETMYFGSHNNRSQLRLFQWQETATSVESWNINVTQWNGPTYSAPGPDGRDWLGRCDPRITGAWVAEGIIGFMWTVDSKRDRPLPHIRVARIDASSKALIDQPDIWSRKAAWAYPAASPNCRGDIGYSMFYGGGERHPGHVVGIRDAFASPYNFALTRTSTNGPSANKWGDYCCVEPHSPDGLTWVASGYTLRGDSGADVEPRYVHFGRRRDERAAERWENS